MGSGSFSTDVYEAARRMRVATGSSAFAYHDSGARSVHEQLDPKSVAMRESRDSDEHPQSTPIIVCLDVTGSMADVPRSVQAKLPQLMGMLLRGGLVSDPQLMFAAIGDATCDRVPLQVTQFESDNRIDEQLGNFVLEGGGGGQRTESYELAAFFFTRHTATDAFEKHGRKGLLFFVGDEMAYPQVNPREAREVLGEELSEPVSSKAIFDELQQRYEVWFLIPQATSHGHEADILEHWRALLGQQAVIIPDTEAIVETIARLAGLSADQPEMATAAA